MGLVWVEVVVMNPDTGRHAAAKALRAPQWPWSPRRIAARSKCKSTPLPFVFRWRLEHHGHRSDDFQRL